VRLEDRLGDQARQFIKLDRRFQIFGDAAHVLVLLHQATHKLDESPEGARGRSLFGTITMQSSRKGRPSFHSI
jgi:hypothetical protein